MFLGMCCTVALLTHDKPIFLRSRYALGYNSEPQVFIIRKFVAEAVRIARIHLMGFNDPSWYLFIQMIPTSNYLLAEV